jgi:excinuclease UvrABC nuclease subunit
MSDAGWYAASMTDDVLALAPELVSNAGRHALYRFYSDKGELLYVGTSGDFGRRFPVHAQKIWFLQVRGITLEWYASEDDALKAERRAIHVEHPRYNVQHRETRTLSGTPQRQHNPRPYPRAGRDRAAALIKRYPHLTNAEIAQKAGVHLRTVQRARNGPENDSTGSTT